MRKWIDLFENPRMLYNPEDGGYYPSSANVITVYHGDTTEDVQLHSGMFFSSDRDFATGYGQYISEYELDLTDLADSLDSDLIGEFLPLYDPYDDVEINDIDQYMERSSDTWEIVEPVALRMVSLVPRD